MSHEDSSAYSFSEKETNLERLSSNETRSYSHKKKENHSKGSIVEELKKKKPLTFDGEIKKGEE